LHEGSPSNHTGADADFELHRALTVVDFGHSRHHADRLAHGDGAQVREVDRIAGGILVGTEVPLDQQASGLLDVANHPRRGVNRMHLPVEQPGGHFPGDLHLVGDLFADLWMLAHLDTMPEVEGISETQLAERSGVTVEHVRNLSAVGILVAALDGSYRPSDIQRVKLADALEASGISLADIGRAIGAGHLSFSFLDLLFTQPAGYTPKTYRQICEEFGWSTDFIERVHEALGLPPPSPDDRVREDDMQMFPIGQFALSLGMSEANVIRVLRVYGDNLGRIAEAESQFFHTNVEEPLVASGMPEGQLLEIAAQVSPSARAQVETLMMWLYHRHQEHSIIEHVVGHVEDALEQAGVTRRKPTRPPAMMFLDLAGYTRLTEERGDDVAAELAATLAGLVQRESRRRGGRPIKWLGDGVMFHFAEPRDAVPCALDLVALTPAEGLPPAHVGVNAGPVVFRDGDYFGRTVNIAARIASRASPGEVLVSEDVVAAGRPDGVRYEEIGPVPLKGVSRPVTLHRAFREQ
jgi:adenylate cyclase